MVAAWQGDRCRYGRGSWLPCLSGEVWMADGSGRLCRHHPIWTEEESPVRLGAVSPEPFEFSLAGCGESPPSSFVVCLVNPVSLFYLSRSIQPNKRDKPEQPSGSHTSRMSRTPLADVSRILLNITGTRRDRSSRRPRSHSPCSQVPAAPGEDFSRPFHRIEDSARWPSRSK